MENTKGNWKASFYTKGARLYYDDSKDLYEGLITEIDEQGIQSQVAQVYPAYREEYGRLFASAPDMYEALKQNIVDYKVLCQRKPKNTLLQTRLAMAQKALAKAEGKEK